MSRSYVAIITLLHETGLRPTHPIAPGGGGWWGQANDPGYGIDIPVDPGYGIPVGGVPHPSHPIYWPPGTRPHPSHPIWRPDLGIWGGPWLPPYVDAGLPPFPTHLPVVPPGGVWPTPPSPPLGTWGGAGEPFPTPPIAGPGRPPNWGMANDPGYGIEEGGKPAGPGGVPIQLPGQDPSGGGWVYAYVPGYGWMWIRVSGAPGSGTEPPTTPPGYTPPGVPHPEHPIANVPVPTPVEES
jgi:hypothetical protein